MAKLCWLHISDIHFCHKNDWRDTTARDKLIKLLKESFESEEDSLPKPDIIFCTGDIAQGEITSGQLKDQYKSAQRFFDELLGICNLEKNRLFVVPGNHDVNREKVSSSFQDGLIRRSLSNINKDWAGQNYEYKQAIARLDEYGEFVKDYLSHQPNSDGRHCYSNVIEINGIKLGVAGFNSAWSCYGDQDKNNLWMAAEWQFNAAVKELDDNACLTIGLMHHPISWLKPEDESLTKRRRQSAFHFWLHGHEHDSWVVPTNQGSTIISAGAVNASQDSEFGVNLVELDLEKSEGKVHLYAYKVADNEWFSAPCNGALKGIYDISFKPAINTGDKSRAQAFPTNPDEAVIRASSESVLEPIHGNNRAKLSDCPATRDHAIQLLESLSNTPFFRVLAKELTERLHPSGVLDHADSIVDLITSTDQPCEIQNIFYATRNSMKEISEENGVIELKTAAALYYIAFRQLVKQETVAKKVDNYLFHIQKFNQKDYPDFQEVGRTIAAIIASAVFGGVMDFVGEGENRKPEHVYAIVIPSNADDFESQIDRAIYAALFPGTERATEILDGSTSLTPGDYGRIETEIDAQRIGEKKAMAFWVQNGELYIEALGKVGKTYKVPMLLECSDTMADILGMDVARLLAELQYFWRKDAEIRQKHKLSTKYQEKPLMPTKVEISVNAGDSSNVAVTAGNHNSTAQTSHQHTQTGIDHAALAPLLAVLQEKVATINDPDACTHYSELVTKISNEAKAPAPDKSKIKNYLEQIKNIPGYLKSSQEIVTAADKLFDYLSQIFT